MPHTASLRARNLAFWTQTAPGWIRHADRHDHLGRPLGRPAMDWLRPRAGERILDVGCGCGGTTAALAEAVAPTGQAVGVDLAESMVAAARRRFPLDRHPGLRFVAADIETVGVVPGAPFDAVFSRMALMLLADPVDGCIAIRRSLRPGARLAATVFRDGTANPWLAMAVLGAAPHLDALPPLPLGEEPGPFAFAQPARIERILTAAGFEGITIQPPDVTLEVPDEPDTVAEWLIEMGPASAAYRAAPPARQAAARSATAGLLARFGAPGGDSGVTYRLPAGLWLITATTPK
ncbi:class I SAM-dependent methyltransferase [Actinomadura mexicana]|uniref:Ubiquinone/menaquinone biosynthesis C-methylase UbiE n=1 Tax=Actinomadura mexicana TaxID=134959 RepID=A0A239HV99_9ACTN|nr:class I SAM-dependent methyltransferase [Actinomadura mexicana]SNS85161.1 Ubiquinone/menaquinone biosynthesis C-methylase UbiE [Actinomadura mexicana]